MAEEPVKEKVEEVPPVTPPIPDENKNRNAEQFDKLTKSNQELKEERDQYKNLFESLRPAEVTKEDRQAIQEQFPNVNKEEVNKTLASMVDENGYLDGNKLAQTLQAMDAQNKQAQIELQRIKQDNQQKQTQAREREEKEAMLKVYEKYPQLDPTNTEGIEKDGATVKFDPKMWQYVYNDLAATAKKGVMPSETDYMVSADKVFQDLYEGREDMTKKDKEEKEKVEDQKRQINASRPRSTMQVGYYENQEEDALIQQVRDGKRGAVGALLRKRGL